jgi:addiction module RelE/StbE family toxin
VGLKVVYSKNSKQDLKEIYNYIRRDSLRYAQIEIKLITSAIIKLEFNPLLGKRFEKSDDELTREMVFKNYRIIYDIIGDKHILILSIHHHARLISNNPAFKGDE